MMELEKDARERKPSATVRIKRRIKELMKLYNVADWSCMVVVMDTGPDYETDEGWRVDGECTVLPRYNQARITVMDDLGEREEFVLRHEAAHILTGEMRGAVKRILDLFVTDEEQRDAALSIFTDAEEHTVNRLARAPFHGSRAKEE